MKKFKILILFVATALLLSCEEEKPVNGDVQNDLDILSSFSYGTVFSNYVTSSVGPVHSIQHAGVVQPHTTAYSSSINSQTSFVGTVYTDGVTVVNNSPVTCEGTTVPLYPGSVPLRNFHNWGTISGPNPGDMIDWTFVYGGSTVITDCPMPSDFGLITNTNGSSPVDMSTGTTVNWLNGGSGDIIVNISYITYNSVSGNIDDQAFVFANVIPDNGSFSISSSDFTSWGVPTNATHMSVQFIRANYVVDQYDSGALNCLSVCTVETAFTFELI